MVVFAQENITRPNFTKKFCSSVMRIRDIVCYGIKMGKMSVRMKDNCSPPPQKRVKCAGGKDQNSFDSPSVRRTSDTAKQKNQEAK